MKHTPLFLCINYSYYEGLPSSLPHCRFNVLTKIGLVPFGLQKDQGVQLRKIIYPPAPSIRNQKSVVGENIRKALPPPTHSKD